MAKSKKPNPSQPSDVYAENAKDFWKGTAWFVGLGWFIRTTSPKMSVALILVGAVLCVIGVVLYVFSHQAEMLEAADAVASVPKQASEP